MGKNVFLQILTVQKDPISLLHLFSQKFSSVMKEQVALFLNTIWNSHLVHYQSGPLAFQLLYPK